MSQKRVLNPWAWVPSSYIAEGIPFSMVIWVAGTMFKDLGHSDGEITVATASIGIAWSLKPLWADFLDMFRTKKFFVLSTEFFMAALFCVMGLALPMDSYFGPIIGVMWVLAFMSATQDICVDGVYITSLDKKRQAAFIGVQGMAWNLGRIIAVSAVVWLAGYFQTDQGLDAKTSWMYALFAAGGLMGGIGLYHIPILPTGSVNEDKPRSAGDVAGRFLTSAADFCNKRALWGMLAFVFFYRSAEGLLLVEAPLFIQGCIEDGGLQLSLKDKGAIDGMISTIVSIAGGLLGGLFISRFTLKRVLIILALCVNVPNACYLYLTYAVSPDTPLSFTTIATVVSIEKFWYGFGFVGNMLYMMQQIAPGRFRMTHYAFATALMNLVLVPTQMISGPLADNLGFDTYFWVVMFAAIPSLIGAYFAPFPQNQVGEDGPAVDDDSRLSDGDRAVQAIARRASIFTLLSVLFFLVVDVFLLGRVASAESGIALAIFLVLLSAGSLVKVALAAKGIVEGRRCLAEVERHDGEGAAYASNGKGAIIVGGISIVVAMGSFGYTGKVASDTDWDCAMSDRAKECLQPEAGHAKKECRHELDENRRVVSGGNDS